MLLQQPFLFVVIARRRVVAASDIFLVRALGSCAAWMPYAPSMIATAFERAVLSGTAGYLPSV